LKGKLYSNCFFFLFDFLSDFILIFKK